MSDILGERIRSCRNELKISGQKLADMTGLSQAIISKYERGEKKPSLENLKLLATSLNVTVAYLMGETDATEPAQTHKPIPDEWKIIDEPLIPIPLLTDEAAACCGNGNPIIDQSQIAGYLYVLASDIGAADPERPTFAISASGDSMENAGIYYDTKIVINPAREPRRGDVIVADYCGSRLVRYYMPTPKGLDLVPANPKYPTIHLTPEEISPDLGIYHFVGTVCILVSKPQPCE